MWEFRLRTLRLYWMTTMITLPLSAVSRGQLRAWRSRGSVLQERERPGTQRIQQKTPRNVYWHSWHRGWLDGTNVPATHRHLGCARNGKQCPFWAGWRGIVKSKKPEGKVPCSDVICKACQKVMPHLHGGEMWRVTLNSLIEPAESMAKACSAYIDHIEPEPRPVGDRVDGCGSGFSVLGCSRFPTQYSWLPIRLCWFPIPGSQLGCHPTQLN